MTARTRTRQREPDGFSGGVNQLVDQTRQQPLTREELQRAVVGGQSTTEVTEPSIQNAVSTTYESMVAAMGTPTIISTARQMTATEAMVRQEIERPTTYRYNGVATPGSLDEETTPPPEETEKVPEDKDWEKVYTSKQSIRDKVSHIIAHASYTRLRDTEKRLMKTEEEHRSMKRAIREGIKREKELSKDFSELKKRKKELDAETFEQKKERARLVVNDVLSLPKVKRVEIDKTKRIVITTEPIEIKKDYWDKPRNTGAYQIVVDFYKPMIRDGVRVINIEKRFEHYDHPCINNTVCCWGNIANDIKKDFRERDLLELVVDMLLYISSPNDEHGFLEYSKKAPNETKKQGWEQFLEFSKAQPKRYSIWKYEKEEKQTEEFVLTTLNPPTTIQAPTIRLEATSIGTIPTPQERQEEEPLRLDSENFRERFGGYINQLFEFVSPQETEAFIRYVEDTLRRSNILCIIRLEVRVQLYLMIHGWTLDGIRIQQIPLDRFQVHLRERHTIYFQRPFSIRDFGGLYQYAQFEQTPNYEQIQRDTTDVTAGGRITPYYSSAAGVDTGGTP